MADTEIIELNFDDDSVSKDPPKEETAPQPEEQKKKRPKSGRSKRRTTKKVQEQAEPKPEVEAESPSPQKAVEEPKANEVKDLTPVQSHEIERRDHREITVQTDLSRYTAIERSKIRKNFIRKVLILLAIQISVSVILVALATSSRTGVKNFIVNHEGLYILAIWVSIIIILLLICKRDIVRKVPKNYVIFGTFTLSMSYVLAAIASMTGGDVVMISAILTCAVVFSIAIYAYKTKNDLTKQGPLVASLPTILIIMIILGIIYPTQFIYVFSGAVFAAAFAFYLAYDIQTLLGRFELKYNLDDYVLAAIDIYIDIYTIFTQLMRFLSNFF